MRFTRSLCTTILAVLALCSTLTKATLIPRRDIECVPIKGAPPTPIYAEGVNVPNIETIYPSPQGWKYSSKFSLVQSPKYPDMRFDLSVNDVKTGKPDEFKRTYDISITNLGGKAKDSNFYFTLYPPLVSTNDPNPVIVSYYLSHFETCKKVITGAQQVAVGKVKLYEYKV